MKQETREAYEEEKRRIRRRAMIERARQEKLRRQRIRKIILHSCKWDTALISNLMIHLENTIYISGNLR